MGHLLPQIPGCPAHAVVDPIVLGDVAPTAGAALGAKQLFQPLIAEHQHGIGMDHQLGPFGGHAPLLQFFRAQQMQKIFPAIAFDALIQVGWAEQCAALGTPVTSNVDTTDQMISRF